MKLISILQFLAFWGTIIFLNIWSFHKVGIPLTLIITILLCFLLHVFFSNKMIRLNIFYPIHPRKILHDTGTFYFSMKQKGSKINCSVYHSNFFGFVTIGGVSIDESFLDNDVVWKDNISTMIQSYHAKQTKKTKKTKRFNSLKNWDGNLLTKPFERDMKIDKIFNK